MLKAFKKLILITMACTVLLSCLGAFSFAKAGGSISLSVVDNESGEPIENAAFRIYRFASAQEKNGSYSFSFTEEFKSNGMKIDELSNAYFPLHLSVFANRNNLTYTEGKTDAEGNLSFSDLLLGAYLVVPMEVKEGYLLSNPFIVTLPIRDAKLEEWQFDVTASPKVEAEKTETEKTYFSVKKQWFGEGKHPEKVRVALIKDGFVVEEADLNQSNNWYFRWDDLENNHSWNVVEIDAPIGYAVNYEGSQMSVVIKNTILGEDDDDSEHTPEDTTGGTKPPEDDDKLIQTGQLKWPIPVLSIAGILLFSIGWAMRYIGKKSGEER